MSGLLGGVSECVRHRGPAANSIFAVAATTAHRRHADQPQQRMAPGTINGPNERILSGQRRSSRDRPFEVGTRMGKRCRLGCRIDVGGLAFEYVGAPEYADAGLKAR